MSIAKVFTTGRSQAIRLPKEFRFSEDEVTIKKIGDAVLLIPTKSQMKLMFEGIKEFHLDFDVSPVSRFEKRPKL